MKTVTVLHVEDDIDATYFLKRALEKAKLEINLKQLKDGEEAIRYLDGAAPFENRETHHLPSIILLDLKMPIKDGFEVLEWIKQRNFLSAVPVIILTSSDRQEDLQRAKSLGADSYLTKTISYANVIQALQDFLKNKSAPPG